MIKRAYIPPFLSCAVSVYCLLQLCFQRFSVKPLKYAVLTCLVWPIWERCTGFDGAGRVCRINRMGKVILVVGHIAHKNGMAERIQKESNRHIFLYLAG